MFSGKFSPHTSGFFLVLPFVTFIACVLSVNGLMTQIQRTQRSNGKAGNNRSFGKVICFRVPRNGRRNARETRMSITRYERNLFFCYLRDYFNVVKQDEKCCDEKRIRFRSSREEKRGKKSIQKVKVNVTFVYHFPTTLRRAGRNERKNGKKCRD